MICWIIDRISDDRVYLCHYLFLEFSFFLGTRLWWNNTGAPPASVPTCHGGPDTLLGTGSAGRLSNLSNSSSWRAPRGRAPECQWGRTSSWSSQWCNSREDLRRRWTEILRMSRASAEPHCCKIKSFISLMLYLFETKLIPVCQNKLLHAY